ncbi:hypothetical protein P0F65_04355 [Sphingomonas sp. I4]
MRRHRAFDQTRQCQSRDGGQDIAVEPASPPRYQPCDHRAAACVQCLRPVNDTVPDLFGIGGQQDVRRPRLRRHPQQGGLQVVVARKGRNLGDAAGIEPGDTRPGHLPADPLQPRFGPCLGHHHQRVLPTVAQDQRDHVLGRDQPVRQYDQPRQGMQLFGGLDRAAHRVDHGTALGDAGDRAKQFGVSRATTMMICAAPAATSSRA